MFDNRGKKKGKEQNQEVETPHPVKKEKQKPKKETKLEKHNARVKGEKRGTEGGNTTGGKKKYFLIGGGVLVVLLLMFSLLSGGGSEQAPPATDVMEEEDTTHLTDNTEEEDDVPKEIAKGTVVDEDALEDEEEEANYQTYENGYIGVKMNYPSEWYYKERVHEKVSVIDESLGGKPFTVSGMALKEKVELVEFFPTKSQETKVTVSFSPMNLYELENKREQEQKALEKQEEDANDTGKPKKGSNKKDEIIVPNLSRVEILKQGVYAELPSQVEVLKTTELAVFEGVDLTKLQTKESTGQTLRVTPYTFESYAEVFKGVQVTLLSGSNGVVYNLYSKDEDDFEKGLQVLKEVIETTEFPEIEDKAEKKEDEKDSTEDKEGTEQ